MSSRSSWTRILTVVALTLLITAPLAAQQPSRGTPPVPNQKKKQEKKIAASHIYIAYKGSAWAPRTVTRSREEAKALADELHAKVRKNESFDDLATAHSDDESKAQAGYLGLFEPSKMVDEFKNAVVPLEVGQISPVVETAFGFHIIRREPAIRVSHIVVSYAGTSLARQNKARNIKRTKEEAQALAEDLRKQAMAEETNFGALARTHSDGPSGPQGGDLGVFSRGQFLPEFEAAAMKLKLGEVSEVVETTYGFHVIVRTE